MERADRNVAAARCLQDRAEGWTRRGLAHAALSPAFLRRCEAVAGHLRAAVPVPPVERALDLGCGTGPHLPFLAQLAREVIGMDIAPAMLAEVRQSLSRDLTNVTLVEGSMLAMPFPDDYGDLGVCIGVVEYFDDPVAVLRLADALPDARPRERGASWAEPRRDTLALRHIGDDLIVTVRKPGR